MSKQKTLRLGIVSGEVSGDLLGSRLVRQFRDQGYTVEVEGVLGPELIAEGGKALFPMESLAVMGLIEPLKHLPRLLSIRRHLYRHFKNNPPDIFVGIDSPDFNLSLEKKLHRQGIKTVHYVSPSVWAWRRGRIKTIKKAVDLMLALFPFELAFYKEHEVAVVHVGHPLADEIPLEVSKIEAQQRLALLHEGPFVALLPGSRVNEIQMLASVFFHAARLCVQDCARLRFLVPCVNERIQQQIMEIQQQVAPDLPVHYILGRSREVMAAADVILLASGTATLEAMLLKRPMVVAYRMARLSYHLAKRLVKIPFFSLPNLLAGKALVPEFLQDEVQADRLAKQVLAYLRDPEGNRALLAEFSQLHEALKPPTRSNAAQAILALLPDACDD